MTTCVTIKIPKYKICIADLNKRVQILKRAIVAPIGQPSFLNTQPMVASYDFQTVATVWAAIKNIKGDAILDGVSVNDIPTHWFYIRYRDDVTKDNWISYNNEYYRIMEVTNLTEDNTYLQIKTIKTGETAKQAAQT